MTEDKKHQLDEIAVTDIVSYLGTRLSSMEEHIRRKDKCIKELEKKNAELKAEIRKMKSQHFTDIRLYTKVIGIAVEESVMNDKQNYKNYLFDKAKKILSMGVDK